ncbi:MAG: hypothetical protein K2M48_06700, partial [Clostridiales bacterium]|nr:hypothetical protein [Clostridiales bacterium]
ANTENPAPATEAAAPEQPAPTGKRAKFLATRNKVSAFEQKHSIIVNALLAVCSLIIMLVTVLAPVKVMAYANMPVMDEGSFESGESSYHYIEIDQPIWNFVEALGYISLDASDINDVVKAQKIIQEYQDAASKMALTEDQFADNISDVNYIAYILAISGGDGFSSLFESIGGAAFATVVFGVVVFILAAIMSIMSLVHLIFAIVGMAKQKPTKGLFKYLFNMMSFSVSALSLLAFAPMTKVGGSMFAVLLFGSILMLLLGAGSALVMGRSGLATTIKRAAVSLVMLVATCLLFTNAMSLPKSSTNVPYGCGIYILFSSVASQSPMALGAMVGPAILAIFGCLLVAYAGNALCFSLRALTGYNAEHYEKKSFNNAICLVVFAVIAIVFSFVGAPYITAAINDVPKGDPEALLRAQVYVSASLFLILAILIKAFRPKENPLFGAPPPVSLMETANGAPAPAAAPAQSDRHVTSVEDVAEPVIDEKAEQTKAEQNEINDF